MALVRPGQPGARHDLDGCQCLLLATSSRLPAWQHAEPHSLRSFAPSSALPTSQGPSSCRCRDSPRHHDGPQPLAAQQWDYDPRFDTDLTPNLRAMRAQATLALLFLTTTEATTPSTPIPSVPLVLITTALDFDRCCSLSPSQLHDGDARGAVDDHLVARVRRFLHLLQRHCMPCGPRLRPRRTTSIRRLAAAAGYTP